MSVYSYPEHHGIMKKRLQEQRRDTMQDQIILFDGDCHFCDRSVQFILKRDRHAYFKFASLQSELGQMLLKKYHIPTDTDSFILVTPKQEYFNSSADLNVVCIFHGLST